MKDTDITNFRESNLPLYFVCKGISRDKCNLCPLGNIDCSKLFSHRHNCIDKLMEFFIKKEKKYYKNKMIQKRR